MSARASDELGEAPRLGPSCGNGLIAGRLTIPALSALCRRGAIHVETFDQARGFRQAVIANAPAQAEAGVER